MREFGPLSRDAQIVLAREIDAYADEVVKLKGMEIWC
jgi:hypothetical protein